MLPYGIIRQQWYNLIFHNTPSTSHKPKKERLRKFYHPVIPQKRYMYDTYNHDLTDVVSCYIKFKLHIHAIIIIMITLSQNVCPSHSEKQNGLHLNT